MVCDFGARQSIEERQMQELPLHFRQPSESTGNHVACISGGQADHALREVGGFRFEEIAKFAVAISDSSKRKPPRFSDEE